MPLEVQLLEPRLALASDDSFMQFVRVGDAGNAADTTGYGAVANEYRIGKYEVTNGQYTQFLNAVAKTDPHGLYNTNMGTNLNIAGISRSGLSGSYSYLAINNDGDTSRLPITYVSWWDAARFANWMHNGQPTGAQNATTTEDGAYTLNGVTSGDAPGKNAGAAFYIPTDNEWYKAAYYNRGSADADYWRYATQSDVTPGNKPGPEANQANWYAGKYAVTQEIHRFGPGGVVLGYDSRQTYLANVGSFSGSPSAYGTLDQNGNVGEWTDAQTGRGGSWLDYYSYVPSAMASEAFLLFSGRFPSYEGALMGFRLSAVSRNVVVDADGNPLNGVRIDVKRGSSTLTTVYSDYDGKSTVLDADGITGDFDLEGIAAPAPGQTTTVVVTAKDLNGKTYTRTINVLASQFSGGKITLGTVKLDTYRTVDAAGVIHLHDDQRNNSNDHVIKRRGASDKLVVSARYMAEVRAVTTKLASLGFRETNGTGDGSNAAPLTATSSWATTASPTGVSIPASEKALLLFQTLWQQQGVSGVLKNAVENGTRTVVSGEVSAKDRNNRNTLADLNGARGVIWGLNTGNDFVYQSNNNPWMHASAIRALADLDLAIDGLKGSLATSVRQLTSNSPATGGDRPGVGGTTHHAGGEIDVPWVTTSGTAGSGNFYRGLSKASGVAQSVPLGTKGGNPLAGQEWTRAQRTAKSNALKPMVKKNNPTWTQAKVDAEAARLAEANAYASGKRWIVVDTYDRARTKAFIQKIFALNTTVPNRVRHLYFNDPALLPGGSSAIKPPAGVTFIPIPGHGNHVHFSINCDKKNSLPARGA
jgi:sulfatase modifying factor 1